MAFEDVALWCSIAPILIGTVFMLTAKKQVVDGIGNLDVLKDISLAPEMGGLMVHVFFMLGVVAFCWGITNLGLALGYEPVLAVTIGFTSLFGTFVFMMAAKTGITGVPGLSGPPMPARIIMSLVSIILTVNLVMTAMDDDDVPMSYWLVYVFAIAWPQAIGFKHRSDGWMTAQKA